MLPELSDSGYMFADASEARSLASPTASSANIFTPGDSALPVAELPFGNVGLVICYDLEFPEWVRLAALS